MSRKLPWVAGAVAVAAIAAYLGCGFLLGSALKAGVNTLAPRLTQTRVELRGARISPLGGSGTLTGLTVGNPGGWSDNDAMRFGRIRVRVAPLSLLGDPIIIEDIEIDSPEFNYETRVVRSNLGDLLGNVERLSDGGAVGDAGPAAGNGKPMRFEVRHFLMKEGRIRLGAGAAAITLPMPPIELSDIGTAEGGITANRLALALMRRLTTGVAAATTGAAGRIGSTLGAAAGDAARKAGERLKSLFGGDK